MKNISKLSADCFCCTLMLSGVCEAFPQMCEYVFVMNGLSELLDKLYKSLMMTLRIYFFFLDSERQLRVTCIVFRIMFGFFFLSKTFRCSRNARMFKVSIFNERSTIHFGGTSVEAFLEILITF